VKFRRCVLIIQINTNFTFLMSKKRRGDVLPQVAFPQLQHVDVFIITAAITSSFASSRGGGGVHNIARRHQMFPFVSGPAMLQLRFDSRITLKKNLRDERRFYHFCRLSLSPSRKQTKKTKKVARRTFFFRYPNKSPLIFSLWLENDCVCSP